MPYVYWQTAYVTKSASLIDHKNSLTKIKFAQAQYRYYSKFLKNTCSWDTCYYSCASYNFHHNNKRSKPSAELKLNFIQKELAQTQRISAARNKHQFSAVKYGINTGMFDFLPLDNENMIKVWREISYFHVYFRTYNSNNDLNIDSIIAFVKYMPIKLQSTATINHKVVVLAGGLQQQKY